MDSKKQEVAASVISEISESSSTEIELSPPILSPVQYSLNLNDCSQSDEEEAVLPPILNPMVSFKNIYQSPTHSATKIEDIVTQVLPSEGNAQERDQSMIGTDSYNVGTENTQRQCDSSSSSDQLAFVHNTKVNLGEVSDTPALCSRSLKSKSLESEALRLSPSLGTTLTRECPSNNTLIDFNTKFANQWEEPSVSLHTQESVDEYENNNLNKSENETDRVIQESSSFSTTQVPTNQPGCYYNESNENLKLNVLQKSTQVSRSLESASTDEYEYESYLEELPQIVDDLLPESMGDTEDVPVPTYPTVIQNLQDYDSFLTQSEVGTTDHSIGMQESAHTAIVQESVNKNNLIGPERSLMVLETSSSTVECIDAINPTCESHSKQTSIEIFETRLTKAIEPPIPENIIDAEHSNNFRESMNKHEAKNPAPLERSLIGHELLSSAVEYDSMGDMNQMRDSPSKKTSEENPRSCLSEADSIPDFVYDRTSTPMYDENKESSETLILHQNSNISPITHFDEAPQMIETKCVRNVEMWNQSPEPITQDTENNFREELKTCSLQTIQSNVSEKGVVEKPTESSKASDESKHLNRLESTCGGHPEDFDIGNINRTPENSDVARVRRSVIVYGGDSIPSGDVIGSKETNVRDLNDAGTEHNLPYQSSSEINSNLTDISDSEQKRTPVLFKPIAIHGEYSPIKELGSMPYFNATTEFKSSSHEHTCTTPFAALNREGENNSNQPFLIPLHNRETAFKVVEGRNFVNTKEQISKYSKIDKCTDSVPPDVYASQSDQSAVGSFESIGMQKKNPKLPVCEGMKGAEGFLNVPQDENENIRMPFAMRDLSYSYNIVPSEEDLNSQSNKHSEEFTSQDSPASLNSSYSAANTGFRQPFSTKRKGAQRHYRSKWIKKYTRCSTPSHVVQNYSFDARMQRENEPILDHLTSQPSCSNASSIELSPTNLQVPSDSAASLNSSYSAANTGFRQPFSTKRKGAQRHYRSKWIKKYSRCSTPSHVVQNHPFDSRMQRENEPILDHLTSQPSCSKASSIELSPTHLQVPSDSAASLNSSYSAANTDFRQPFSTKRKGTQRHYRSKWIQNATRCSTPSLVVENHSFDARMQRENEPILDHVTSQPSCSKASSIVISPTHLQVTSERTEELSNWQTQEVVTPNCYGYVKPSEEGQTQEFHEHQTGNIRRTEKPNAEVMVSNPSNDETMNIATFGESSRLNADLLLSGETNASDENSQRNQESNSSFFLNPVTPNQMFIQSYVSPERKKYEKE